MVEFLYCLWMQMRPERCIISCWHLRRYIMRSMTWQMHGFSCQQYYEQMKQSVLEDENYVDALLGNADIIYSVNLTEDVLEQNFFKPGESNKLEDLSDLGMELPCSYDAYCQKYCERLSQETRAAYRMIDTSDKLLKRFENGENQVVIEYREKEAMITITGYKRRC